VIGAILTLALAATFVTAATILLLADLLGGDR
jgi:hypothetical protein